jgi:uncharacterized lipoprotein YmbA
MITTRLFLGTLAIIFISACGSSPKTNYYMLSTKDSGTPGNSGPALGVGPVELPQYLRRSAMVINRDEHLLTLAEFDRWAEPLEDGITRVVALNLAMLLDTQDVQSYPWRRHAAPHFGVSLTLAQLSMRGTSAELVTEWRITDVGSQTVLKQQIGRYITSASSADAAAVAAAYSELMLLLSQDIARSLRSLSTPVEEG